MPTDEDGYPERERRFRQLYDEHYRAVQAYVVRRVHALADVADVVAEVFTTTWRRLGDVPSAPADRVWLYGTARRVLADYYRGRRRQHGLVSRIASVQGTPEVTSLLPDSPDGGLLAAMYQLPSGEREALMLVYWEELSHAEAGQVLGCSANAVGIRVHRAKARLREALGSSAARPRRSFMATSAQSPNHLKSTGS